MFRNEIQKWEAVNPVVCWNAAAFVFAHEIVLE